jgi:6-phosphogluconolactonase
MPRLTKFNRRHFVKMAGGGSLLAAAGSRLGWAELLHAPAPRFAYIGMEHEIHVYSIAVDGSFMERQTIASAHPVAMAIGDRNLYVANGVSEYDSLPRGSVEAFAMHPATGRLEFKNRVPLSLSGVAPRDLALAPDGRSLVVAVGGGGAYNVLPLQEDGRLGRVSGILKETGSGPHASQATARPTAVVFDRLGRVLAADQGSDRLSVLSLSNGELTVCNRREASAGSGPARMALHPNGTRLYVAHILKPSIESFAYDATAGAIVGPRQTVSTTGVGETVSLAIHPLGEALYSSHENGIQAWKIALDGSLAALPGIPGVQVHHLHISEDGKNLFALSRDAAWRMKIHSATYELATSRRLASLNQPLSIITWR